MGTENRCQTSCYNPQSCAAEATAERYDSGCMVCGKPLQYLSHLVEKTCSYCNRSFHADAECEDGHFICDECHSSPGVARITHICLTTRETDMLHLLLTIRDYPEIPMHGPEHHSMVPGIILATFRNLGGKVSEDMIRTGIERGSSVPGGYCGFVGACGAALGVGIAFGVLLDSSPVDPKKRKIILNVTQSVLQKMGTYEAARCCQRDSWIALKKASDLSKELLPITLKAEAEIVCQQMSKNPECIRNKCELFS